MSFTMLLFFILLQSTIRQRVDMFMFVYIIILILQILCFTNTNATTHWVVTETGRIQAYLESPYHLRRPYDLLALLDQEVRNNQINDLYNDLINRKQIIEQKWSSLKLNSDLGVTISSKDPDCLSADKLFSDIDLYANFATNGTTREGIHIDFSKGGAAENVSEKPLCSKFSRLNKQYKNLAEVENNTNMNLLPDQSLKEFIPVESKEIFGHEITVGLKKNSSSWLHYNLAAIFWRIEGDGNRAVDCIKRAIQYVPREYQDIPLYNLAGILHQARHSKESLLILHSAIDIAPHESIHYLAIGKVYAAIGEYNKSVAYYDKFLEKNPERTDVLNIKHATKCYWKLEREMMSIQESLQSILSDLHDYHSHQQQWLRLQERLMWEHASFDYQFDGMTQDFPNAHMKIIQRCIQKTSEDAKPIISCSSYKQGPEVDMLNLQNLFEHVESEKQKISKKIGKNNDRKLKKDVSTQQKTETPPVLYPKFPTTMSTSGNQYFDVTGWPTKEQCLSWNLPAENDDLNLPLFLPPENKGYQIKKILSEYIGLEEGSQHELPWYPPVCDYENVFGEKYIPSGNREVLNNAVKSTEYLKNQLLKYVNNGKADEAEIGQRIITAMEKITAPRWVLVTLASLYWRVRGNPKKALDCLDIAFQDVPKDSTDVVLVSIGSVVYQLGFLDQALQFATLAYKINYIEPSTNFLLAIVHYSNNNPLLAVYYMKNVLRADPEFYDGMAENLLKTWGCRIKLGSYTHMKGNDHAAPKEVCEGKETVKSEAVICSISGVQCKNSAIACNKKTGEEPLSKPLLKKSFSSCDGSKRRTNFGHTISSLLAAETSGETEPDQSRLERMTDLPKSAGQAFHMRLSLGDDPPHHEHAMLGDFYVSVALTEESQNENTLNVYDKFGTYTLSATGCSNIEVHRFTYSSVWPSIVARSLDLTSYLTPKSNTDDDIEDSQPHCMNVPQSTSIVVNHIFQIMQKHKLPNSSDEDLAELLGLMASDQKSSFKELGTKIDLALKENSTSWILATASAIYWRIIGNTEEVITCFRLALTYVPSDQMDIPLLHLAHLLNRAGYNLDALEVAQIAIKVHHNFVLNHFTVANIYMSMGEFETAVAYYRMCLALDSNFEPARVILQSVLCSLLFDEIYTRKYSDLAN